MGGMYDIVGIEAAANVVIRAAIIARLEALGAKLVQSKRISISEEAAVGEFIQVVRPGVVGMSGKPIREVMPDTARQTVVVRYRAVQPLRNGPKIGRAHV